jgi:serine/threonine-protein kinase RsbT
VTTSKSVIIAHDTDIVIARREGRAMATPLGFSSGELALIATAISEVARNIVVYAKRGEVLLEIVEKHGRKGIKVIARDQGPGIADVERAMQDGFSTSKSLGLGLPGARRLMDDFHIESVVGQGTTITMTKWGR